MIDNEEKRRAADLLKNMIVEQKSSPWPKILGVIITLMILSAAAYWFYLPSDKRPTLGDVETKLQVFANSVLNTPVSPSSPASSSPAAAPNKSASPPASSDTGLLSN